MSSKSTELTIISAIEEAAPQAGPGQLNRIGDDCAVLRPETGQDLVVTKDCMVEGVHFDLRYAGPRAVGVKLATSNLSDIGAGGASPRWALLAIGFKGKYPARFYRDFLAGLVSTLANHGVALVGGDTVSSPCRLFFCLTLLGTTPRGRCLSRAGARPGDVIFSSGPLGDSAAGLILLQRFKRKGIPYGIRRYLVKRHLYPTYPHLLGRALLEGRVASSAIDSSDGLAKDLMHISERSGVACIIRRSMLPLSRPARFVAALHGIKPCQLALRGGEDFTLIWTSPKDKSKRALEIASAILKRPPYEIGCIEPGRGVYIEDPSGRRRRVEEWGYVHT